MKKSSIRIALPSLGALVIVLVLFFSCAKEPNVNSSSTAGAPKTKSHSHLSVSRSEVDADGYFVEKPKIRLRWAGVSGNINCTGDGCGWCAGLCVMFGARIDTSAISTDDYNSGVRFAKFKLYNTGGVDYLDFAPEGDCNNGDGKTRLNSDFNLGDEVSYMMGHGNVTISAGTYTIDYSNKDYPWGIVTFRVTLTD